MKLSIIIPVYNEERTIERVLQRLAGLEFAGWEKEIIVVDDGSNDSSKLIAHNSKLQLKAENFILVSHKKNQGKGVTIKTGLKHATGDAVVIQDADLEYDPGEIRVLLERFDPNTVVYGSRNLAPKRRGYSLYVFGAACLTWLVNLLYRVHLTDVYTGYKLFPADIIKKINLQSRGFEFEMEVTAKLLRRGVKIIEVPISYNPRKFHEGKKIRARDGIVGVWVLLKNYFAN